MAPRPDRELPAVLPPSEEVPDEPSMVLLKKENGSFSTTNPFEVKRALAKLCGPLESAKVIRSGALLIKTKDPEQTKAILDTTTLAGQPIKATIANRLSLKHACIRSDALTTLSNEDLLHELADQGVVRVERLRSKNIKEMGPNPMAKVSFVDQPPQYLYCSSLRVRVDPWIPRCPNAPSAGTTRISPDSVGDALRRAADAGP